MEETWRRHGGDMEETWRRHGGECSVVGSSVRGKLEVTAAAFPSADTVNLNSPPPPPPLATRVTQE